MEYSTLLYSFAFLIITLFHGNDGTCTDFPTNLQSGTWFSSDMGSVTFTSSQYVASKVADFGQITFTCVSSSNTRYYSVSDAFTFLGQQFKIAMCFNLTEVSSNMYYYYPQTGVLPNTDVSRVTFQLSTYSFTEAETCAESFQNISNHRVLVKDGYINQTALTCNNGVLGQYTYSFDGYSSCNDTYLDVCTNNTEPTFNYTACANQTSFSAGGAFSCVYSEDYGTYGYQIVYNQDTSTDETTYYRFACWMYSYVYNQTHVTMYPQACLEDQNYTTIGSPGMGITLVANVTCAVIDTTTTTTTTTTTVATTTTIATTTVADDETEAFAAGAIVAVVLALILIIIAVVIMAVLYYVKVHKVKRGKIQPSDSIITAKSPPLDTKDHSRTDGRVSPVSPYPTISEIAVYRFGPEEIDDDDGGMTLDATTPGFTDGRRKMYKDVERESQASIPIYSEVGGETPEPTRLSEVQTRMSEMSEANINDPTPWTMTRATMNIPEETTVSPIGSPTENKPNGTVQSPRDNGNVEDVTL